VQQLQPFAVRIAAVVTHATDRILTTHVGSLPRPAALLNLMRRRVQGTAIDEAALDAQLRTAVDEVVRRQVATGIDLVRDGELSKPSYATYVTERLTGFGSSFKGHVPADLRDFRDHSRHLVEIGGVVPRGGGACRQGEVHPNHEHEWVVFRSIKLPEDKILVPGVIDSTSNYSEHPEVVANDWSAMRMSSAASG
jgi:methionine synthase II (cobalamin-independent)